MFFNAYFDVFLLALVKKSINGKKTRTHSEEKKMMIIFAVVKIQWNEWKDVFKSMDEDEGCRWVQTVCH